MAGKERLVSFFSGVETDENEVVKQYGTDWWANLLEHVEGLPDEARRTTYRRRRYVGSVQQTRSPSMKFLYLGKVRPGADWPDIVDAHGDSAPLASTGVSGLIEPLYLVPVSGTPYMAVMRTSGGPTWEALTDWIMDVGKYVQAGKSLHLQPYARKDQLERLAQAVGATKIHLKFDPEGAAAVTGRTQLGRSVQEAAQAGAGAVSVEMIVSFGRTTPDEAGAEELVQGVQEIVGTNAFTKAEATILRQGSHGLEKDWINFALDKVVLTEAVGDSEDETPTPEAVMSAMSEAIRRFRDRLSQE